VGGLLEVPVDGLEGGETFSRHRTLRVLAG
jgi:hypothetical protein